MFKIIAAASIVALAGCSDSSRSTSASAQPAVAAPTGITSHNGGGMRSVDPQSYQRGAISTTRTQ